MKETDPFSVVYEIYTRYWPHETPDHVLRSESRRLAFALAVLLDRVPPPGIAVDLGGGWGAFSCACAAVGYRAILVDDYGDPGHANQDLRHRMPGDYAVETVRRDFITDGLAFEPNSIDAITSFDSMEHWHHSPRKLFHQAIDALRPGGLFFLGAPNCNDFAKRITVPLGVAEWSPFEWWYHEPVFRSHVREPSVSDFPKIAADLGLTDVRVWGRCDSLQLHGNRLVRAIGKVLSYPLSLQASLCTQIYFAGRKSVETRLRLAGSASAHANEVRQSALE
jgi:SAM-dependent methyltransferase